MTNCITDGCEKKTIARSLCKYHYERNKRLNIIDSFPRELPSYKGVSCSVDGCDDKAKCKSYCNRHYCSSRRRQDPSKVGKRREYTGDLRKHELYSIWDGMKQRTCNPNNAAYSNYGGRGIRVCNRWKQSCLAFIADMGERPSNNHSLDRIDNDGDYTPDNCRWATKSQQQLNRRARGKSGYTGIELTKQNKFSVRFNYKYKRYYLGVFETLEQAREALKAKKLEVVGDE